MAVRGQLRRCNGGRRHRYSKRFFKRAFQVQTLHWRGGFIRKLDLVQEQKVQVFRTLLSNFLRVLQWSTCRISKLPEQVLIWTEGQLLLIEKLVFDWTLTVLLGSFHLIRSVNVSFNELNYFGSLFRSFIDFVRGWFVDSQFEGLFGRWLLQSYF